MDIILGLIIGSILIACILLLVFEFRIRQPDVLVLYESNGRIDFRKGLLYPRHFSLPLKRTIHPIQLNTEIVAAGNLEVSIKLVGSVAPSPEHIQSLIRVGGWKSDAVARAAEEAQILIQGFIKAYSEQYEIQALTSTDILNHIHEQAALIEEKLGVDLISLAILSLEPTDPEIASALQQQEQARLLEQTEHLNHQARVAVAKSKYQTDEEIAEMDHALALKKVKLNKALLEEDATLAQHRLEQELARDRMRLAFEKEEVDVLKSNPELLMLTPQAARLAEASQNLKNARTVISLTPQELAHGTELLDMFKAFLLKTLESKQDVQGEAGDSTSQLP